MDHVLVQASERDYKSFCDTSEFKSLNISESDLKKYIRFYNIDPMAFIVASKYTTCKICKMILTRQILPTIIRECQVKFEEIMNLLNRLK